MVTEADPMAVLLAIDVLDTSDQNAPHLLSQHDESLTQQIHCDLYDFVVFSLIIGFICLFGLAGNVLSFIVLWKHKSETAAIFLLQCMAVSDFLLLVCAIFLYTLPVSRPGYLFNLVN